ncbi:MAG: hypothetical protein CM15mP49_09330 [Actinomycetota bacterium]|nr:MAG: hypothetical protein CM15mP49_09330 [Actinomycetota bacterium]
MLLGKAIHLARQKRSQGEGYGIDLGSKRIGIALSDSDLTVATPLDVVERSGNVEKTILQFLKSLLNGKYKKLS